MAWRNWMAGRHYLRAEAQLEEQGRLRAELARVEGLWQDSQQLCLALQQQQGEEEARRSQQPSAGGALMLPAAEDAAPASEEGQAVALRGSSRRTTVK